MRHFFAIVTLIGGMLMVGQNNAGAAQSHERAILAGGCFWCIEAAYQDKDGVISAVSGYMGGHVQNPTYEQVSTGTTGHYEVVVVTFDPAIITYEQILEYFWQNVDPFDDAGQFADRGSQYLTAIFYTSEMQKEQAERSKTATQAKFTEKIATKILPETPFYEAEDYHQEYYIRNRIQYELYKHGSGRPKRLDEIWGE